MMLRIATGIAVALGLAATGAAMANPNSHGCACVHNQTGQNINFRYKWGDKAWNNRTVHAKHNYFLCWPYGAGMHTSPTLLFELDVDMTKGNAWTKYDLKRIQSPAANCNAIPAAGHFSIRFRPGTNNTFIHVVKGS